MRRRSGPMSLAAVYHNIGGLEHARGRYKRAEPFARRSVVIREKAVGENHQTTAADIILPLSAVLRTGWKRRGVSIAGACRSSRRRLTQNIRA